MALSSSLLLAGTALTLTVIYYLIQQYRLRSKAQSLGCEPVPTWDRWDLLGFKMSFRAIAAMNRYRMSENVYNMFQEVSEKEGKDVLTFQLAMPPGFMHIFTVDPRNMQAVLATQFKDFQLPEGRVSGFKELLGQGIVSLPVWALE